MPSNGSSICAVFSTLVRLSPAAGRGEGTRGVRGVGVVGGVRLGFRAKYAAAAAPITSPPIT